MSVPTTMFRLTGRDYPPAKLSQASLIIIDAQKEYLTGPLALSGTMSKRSDAVPEAHSSMTLTMQMRASKR